MHQQVVDDARELMLRFESLGGAGHGCEFGLFQREFGAEPLGLLRWADLGYDGITGALRSRFAGVGEEENTRLFVPDGGDEWWTTDHRYWMAMRSFVKADSMPRDRMLAVSLKRQRFLRDKLIADLQAGEKIFVYKDMRETLPRDQLRGLYESVRGYGSNVLLYIGYQDASHPNGTVRVAAPGLIVGYIDHFTFSPDDKFIGSPTQSLLAICREAQKLRASGAVREIEPTDVDAID